LNGKVQGWLIPEMKSFQLSAQSVLLHLAWFALLKAF